MVEIIRKEKRRNAVLLPDPTRRPEGAVLKHRHRNFSADYTLLTSLTALSTHCRSAAVEAVIGIG
jgi:hypothetical protein